MTIVEKVRAAVVPQLEASNLYFHTPKRLLADEATLMKLAESEGLDATVKETLQLALLFHYVGFAADYAAPKVTSLKQAKILLVDSSIGVEVIEYLLNAIHKKIAPENSVEAVFRDTINRYWADKKIRKRLDALKKEQLANLPLKISDEEWFKTQEKALKKVKYFTKYATTNWTPTLLASKTEIKKSLKKLAVEEDNILMEELDVDTSKISKRNYPKWKVILNEELKLGSD